MATIREAFVTEAIAVTPSPTKKLLKKTAKSISIFRHWFSKG
jgi:hypothetical protein